MPTRSSNAKQDGVTKGITKEETIGGQKREFKTKQQ